VRRPIRNSRYTTRDRHLQRHRSTERSAPANPAGHDRYASADWCIRLRSHRWFDAHTRWISTGMLARSTQECVEYHIVSGDTCRLKGLRVSSWFDANGRMRAFQRVGRTRRRRRVRVREYRYDALGRRVMVRSRGTLGVRPVLQVGDRKLIWTGISSSPRFACLAIAESRTRRSKRTRQRCQQITVGFCTVHGGGMTRPSGWTGLVSRSCRTRIGDTCTMGVDTWLRGYTTNVDWVGGVKDPYMASKVAAKRERWVGSLARPREISQG